MTNHERKKITENSEKEFWNCFTFKDNKWITGVTALGRKKRHLLIPEGVIGINDKAFRDCKNNLSSVVIPESVRFIGDHIFTKCNNLKTVVNRSTVLFDWWGQNYKYDGKTLSEMKEINFETITNSDGKPFTKIMPCVFTYKEFQCETIHTGPSMKKIGGFNFLDCPKLTHLEIDENIEYIGADNFCLAQNLNSKDLICHSPILFQCWVKHHKYGDKTLSEMKTIDFSKYTNSDDKPFTELGVESLKDCNILKNLIFDKNFKRINAEAICEGINLKNIQISNKRISFSRYAFQNISPMINFYVSDESLKKKIEKIGIKPEHIFTKPIPAKELEQVEDDPILPIETED